jgi:hypothetical protein
MRNLLKTQFTSPKFDMVVMLIAGIGILPLGIDMAIDPRHRDVGLTFVFIGLVNISNGLRAWWQQRAEK